MRNREERLLIRADASTGAGIGHVMRCLALAQAWRSHYGLVFLASALQNVELRTRIETAGCEFCPIGSCIGTNEDAQEVVGLMERLGCRVAVFDGYEFNEAYYETVQHDSSVTLALDDDGRLDSYHTSFVLNQNLGAKREMYLRIAEGTQFLLGTKYALLREELVQGRSVSYREHVVGEPLRCLVTLGGSDPQNVTMRAMRGLQNLNVDAMSVRVVVGELNPHFDTLASVVANDRRFQLLRNVRNMAEQYEWANFAVVAGGSSNWEMCYFGLPRVVIVIADNQIPIAQELHNAGVAINLGDANKLSPAQISDAVMLFRQNPMRLNEARRISRELVDGLGAVRVVEALHNAVKSL